MGFFNLFKKPPIIQDEFFGELQYATTKNSSKKYFYGNGFFKPLEGEIQYFIYTDSDTPTQAQRDFYQNLQEDFNVVVEKIIPLIEDEFGNWKDGFTIKNFNEEFTLVALTIPDMQIKPHKWDMAFTTIHDENHQVTIDFADDEPSGILIDG